MVNGAYPLEFEELTEQVPIGFFAMEDVVLVDTNSKSRTFGHVTLGDTGESYPSIAEFLVEMWNQFR
jgi:hypothetical protein